MRKIITATSLLITGMLSFCMGQTKLPPGQIKADSTTPQILVYDPTVKKELVLATLDGLELVRTPFGQYILKVIAVSKTITFVKLTYTGITETLTLTSQPIIESLVIARNGQLLTEGVDYTVNSNVVTFVFHAQFAADDIFTVQYAY